LAPRLRLLTALAGLLVLFAGAHSVAAQAGPTVTDGGVQNNFPQGMVFTVSARGQSPIQKIRLRYTIMPDGTAAIGQPEFTPGPSVTASFELEGNNPPKIYLPPGTTIQYYWEVTDAAGNTSKSETATFSYDDTRFDWKPVQQSGVTIYYYSGSEDDARQMLGVATETIASMSRLLGAEITFPVNVWIYDSASDMRPALARRSATFEQSIITAGVRVSSDTVLVLGNVSFDTLRHELTHVVTAVAGESALGSLPAWLDEGTAVYGQGDPGSFESAVDRAIDRGNVLSVRSISAYPGDPDKVELFYGEAWSLVSFLNEKFGPDKFARLFAEVKKGKRIGEALQAVYGFDQDGLEDQWRAFHGLPARETPASTLSPSASGQPSSANGPSDGGGTSMGVIVGLALGTLALAAAVGVAGITLARRFR
jgi:hypothetical protein